MSSFIAWMYHYYKIDFCTLTGWNLQVIILCELLETQLKWRKHSVSSCFYLKTFSDSKNACDMTAYFMLGWLVLLSLFQFVLKYAWYYIRHDVHSQSLIKFKGPSFFFLLLLFLWISKKKKTFRCASLFKKNGLSKIPCQQSPIS